jgi:hypothetical protein
MKFGNITIPTPDNSLFGKGTQHPYRNGAGRQSRVKAGIFFNTGGNLFQNKGVIARAKTIIRV